MSKISSPFSFYQRILQQFEQHLAQAVEVHNHEFCSELSESINYSLFSGGKRFRPQLCLMTAKSFGVEFAEVFPFAAAVEMVHTYSLIHDDLPMMDDDDERRGQPSNHKKFGEATALLAGDSLLTLAFQHLAIHYNDHHMGMRAVELLSRAAGASGMIAGQVIDIEALNGKKVSAGDITTLHGLKTGALIKLCVEGSAVLCHASEVQTQCLSEFGEKLGLAFQIKDDLLDFDAENPEASGLPSLIGPNETLVELQKMTAEAIACLNSEKINFESKSEIDTAELVELAQYNLERKQ